MHEQAPQTDSATEALISNWQKRITAAKEYFKKDFERMEKNEKFAEGCQWPDPDPIDQPYVANITQKHILSSTASLYARNPRAVAKRRKTLDFQVWDERAESIINAVAEVDAAAQAGMEPSPNTVRLLSDYNAGMERREMIEKIGRAQEIIWHYSIDEQIPTFKESCKDLVTAVVTKGVGYVKVGYVREMETRPEDVEKALNQAEPMARINRLVEDMQKGDIQPDSAEVAELRMLLEKAQRESYVVTYEGLTYDFPDSNRVIVDPACKNIVGFLGARWIAHEFELERSEIRDTYGIDPRSEETIGTSHDSTEVVIPKPSGAQPDKVKKDTICVWEVYDKQTQTTFTIADGCKVFLREQRAPQVPVEGFWPIRAIKFNRVVSRKSIYPQSDVDLIRPMQLEYNRARQGIREHRLANRPRHLVEKGVLSEDDKMRLEDPTPFTIIELTQVKDQPLSAMFMPFPHNPIDPSVYDTSYLFDDILRVGGAQDADFGAATSKATATESSIAEGARMSSMQSKIDDIDALLTWVARVSGQILLENMSAETVREIAGPGAIWPEMDRRQIARELYLEVKAGSSGRPNKAVEVANFERLAPVLIQLPGITPEWLAEKGINALDSSIDVTEAIASGLPSVIAMNAVKQQQGGDSANAPENQGAKGASNAPAPPQPQNTQNSVTPPAAAPVA